MTTKLDEVIETYRPVILESPYRADNTMSLERNKAYARACMKDCLLNRGEAPFASHLLYTQPSVLNDYDDVERRIGIGAGISFKKLDILTVVYVDLGISKGMELGIESALERKTEITFRAFGNSSPWHDPSFTINIARVSDTDYEASIVHTVAATSNKLGEAIRSVLDDWTRFDCDH
jgi:hypothetical protein